MAIGVQHRKPARHRRVYVIAATSRDVPVAPSSPLRSHARRWRGPQKHKRGERDGQRARDAEREHGRAPPEARDAERDQRGPKRAGDVLAARHQRDCRPAPAIEPARDVDDERDIDGSSAEQTQQQTVPDEQLPRPAERGEREPRADHDRPEDDGRANADALGDPTECQRPRPGAEPCQRVRKRGNGSRATESAAIGLRATTATRGAPYEKVKMNSTTLAASHDPAGLDALGSGSRRRVHIACWSGKSHAVFPSRACRPTPALRRDPSHVTHRHCRRSLLRSRPRNRAPISPGRRLQSG